MANRFLSNIKINDAYTFPASDGTQGQVISTDGAGNLSFIDASSGGAPVIQKDDFVGDGVTTQFTLGQVVGSVLQTQVYMDGVYQEKETYSVANDVITFTSAPPNGVSIEVISFTSINFAGDFTVDSLQFTGGTGLQGTVTWNADEETLDLVQNGATLQLGQEIQVHVKNQTGSTIPDGTPVYVTGTLGNSGRLTVAPMIADGSIPAKFFLGVTTEDIANGEDGKVTTFGKIRGIDTSMYTEGQTLFVSASTAGAFQTTAPVSPNLDLETAIVINSSSNNGTIFVRAQNGYYLGMLHDVAFSGLADKDLLVYNSTTGIWENSKTLGDITTGNITTSGTVDGVDVSAFKASYDTHNHDDRYYTETEIDTLLTNKANWDTAYSWGDHALAGYLTTETDPVFSASAAAGITSTQITNWDTAYGWGDHSVVGYLTTETDPTVPSHVKGITTTQVSNWDTAYGWGDHSTAGYLTSYTETDPVFSASDAAGITATNISNWDTAYGWGDHSTAGYLTSYTETDTLDSVTDRGATTTNPITVGGAVVNGVITLPQNPVGTTYGNGISTVPSYMIQQGAGDNDGIRLYAEAGVTNDVRFIFEVVDDIEDGDTWVFRNKKTYTDYIANEVVKISGGGDITASGTLSASGYNNSNWDTAYGWGDHDGLYLPIGGKAADSDTVDNYHASQLLRLQEPIFTNAASDDTTGHINFNRDTLVGWDDFIIKHGSSRGLFGKKGIGWHSHTDSSFHVFSTSWTANFGVNSDGTTVSRSSSRAPIFYDSNDTGYYIDPTSNSRLAKLRVESAGNQNGGNIKIGGGGEATNKWSVLTGSHYNDVSESKGIMLIGSFAADGINRVVIGGDIYEANPATEINFHTHTAATHTTGGTKVAGINNSQFYHISSVRSPIFYDYNDTAYYINPNSTTWSSWNAGGARFRNIEISPSSFGDSIQNENAGGNLWLQYSHNGPVGLGYGGGLTTAYNGFTVESGFARLKGGIRLQDTDGAINSMWGIYGWGTQLQFTKRNISTDAYEGAAMFMDYSGLYVQSDYSFRAPIFYDSNDTGFYINPNDTSTIRKTNIRALGSSWDAGLNLYSNNGSDRWNLLTDEGASNHLRIAYNNVERMRIQTDGEVFTIGTGKAGSDYRAPIFYDSNDTNYYVNPNGVSYMNQIDGPYFRNISVPSSGLGNSYDERVILLIPKIETTTSHNNRINGKLTMGKTGGNVIDFFDIEAQSVWNDTTVSFTSKGQRTGHKLVTCTYNGIKWVAIKFQYTANPYNFAWFHGEAITNVSSQAQADMLRVISYVDLQSGTTVLNSEIYNSIADYTPNPLHRKVSFGKGTFHVEAETFLIGGDNMTPQLYLEYDDHASGAGWDTAIIIGKSNDLPEGDGFPAYVPAGSYGTMIKANSDGVFFGMEEYSTGNYRPIIQWGDDDSDTPFRIKHENGSEFTVSYNGDAIATSSLRAPIFYDSDNTGYYTNPAGTSYLYDLDMPHLANGTENIRANVGGQENWRAIALSGSSQDNVGWGIHGTARSIFGRSGTCIHFPDDGSFRLHTNGWDTEFEVEGGGEAWLKGGLRASILYDNNNTTYYVNPASGSYLAGANSINVAPETGVGLKIQGGTNGAHALVLNGGGFSTAAEIFFPSSASGMSIINNGFSGQNAIAFRFGSGSGNYVGGILINTSSTTYATSSDYRLKENVVPMTNALDRVSLLKPSRFNFIGEDKVVDGFIAHEAQEVVPEAVTGEKDAIGWDGNPEYQGIDQSKLVPLLVGAIQELKAEVEALKQQLNGAN